MASPPFVIVETKPADADVVSAHPVDERSMRDNVESWHDFEHGAASGRHKIPKGTVAARDAITDWEAGSLWFNTDATPDALMVNNGTKGTPDWVDVIIPASAPVEIEAGTVMVFYQDAAPTGWTKITASDLNNSALRLVTSTAWAGGKQGGTAFSSVFGAGKSAGGYTLLEADVPAHTHQPQKYTTSSGGSVFAPGTPSATPVDWGPVTSSFGGGGSHNHSLSLDLNYINLIIATKN